MIFVTICINADSQHDRCRLKNNQDYKQITNK